MRGEHLHTELMSKSNSKIIISREIYWLILLVRSLEDLGSTSTMSMKQFSNLRTEVIRVTQRLYRYSSTKFSNSTRVHTAVLILVESIYLDRSSAQY